MPADTNPLPCGCGVKGTPGINLAGTRTEHTNLHVWFCPLHRAAPEMLAALKAATPKLCAPCDMEWPDSTDHVGWHKSPAGDYQRCKAHLARAAIAKAEQKEGAPCSASE